MTSTSISRHYQKYLHAAYGRKKLAERRILFDPRGELALDMTDADFREAYGRRNKDLLFRFARRMTGSNEAAEDIVQESFLRLWRDSAAYDPARGSLRSFLLGVTQVVAYAVQNDVRPDENPTLELWKGLEIVFVSKMEPSGTDLTLRRRGDMDLMRQPRDFQVTDADLRLFDPQVVMDGKPQWSLEGGGVGGPVVWLSVDGRGRFILSLLPNEKFGFRRGGVVSRDGLLIRVAGGEIRVNCSREIAPGEGAFNLYVLHEPDWRPMDSADARMGSADKPEYIIGKK